MANYSDPVEKNLVDTVNFHYNNIQKCWNELETKTKDYTFIDLHFSLCQNRVKKAKFELSEYRIAKKREKEANIIFKY